MDLYFSPLACSMASRIALYEAGLDVAFHRVDTAAGRTDGGADYRAINPMGLVPALRTDDGRVLTENAVVLQAIADAAPASGLAPAPDTPERYDLQQWLSFVSTELHKAVFGVLLSRKAPDGAKAWAREILPARMDRLQAHLAGRDFLLDRFTVADAYLTAVLNWTRFTGVDLTPWPDVAAYFERVSARPSVARASDEEMTLFRAAA